MRGLGWDIDSRFSLEPRRALAAGLVRPHRVHRAPRSGSTRRTAHFRRLPLEPRAPRRQGRRDAAARPRRHASRPRRSRRCRRTRRVRGDLDGATSAPPARAARCPRAGSPQVLTGIDVLRAEQFRAPAGPEASGSSPTTRGARATARPRSTCCTARQDVTLVALFSPEHGIRGVARRTPCPRRRDEKTGLPIHSLYGDTRRPTAAMLQGIDTIVIDLQDVGARFYTYMTTMAYVMEEAAKHEIARRGARPPEPDQRLLRSKGRRSTGRGVGFTAYFPMPIRHGMTLGELAKLFNAEKQDRRGPRRRAELKHWTRDDWFDADRAAVGQPVAEHAQPDPGHALPRHRRDRGHQYLGRARAPTRPSSRSAPPGSTARGWPRALNARSLPGIRFYPVTVHARRRASTPDEECRGVFLIVTDRDAIRPVRVGVEVRVDAEQDVRRQVPSSKPPSVSSDRRKGWRESNPVTTRRRWWGHGPSRSRGGGC